VKQFKIGTVVIGESVNFVGGKKWLEENGANIIDLVSKGCVEFLNRYIQADPKI